MDNFFRSLLFVPADQTNKIEKAWGLGADCVILDLEDGVAPSRKPSARRNIAQYVPVAPRTSPSILVRINAPADERQQDLEVAIRPAVLGVLVPKCGTVPDVEAIAREVGRLEKRAGIAAGKIKLFLLVESARGLLQLPSMAATSDRVAGIVFGAEDWCEDMGIVRTKTGRELEMARWTIAVCAHACGIPAFDTVYTDLQDIEGLVRDTEIANNMGFAGKLAIHPSQIEPIHSVFFPSEAEIAEAEAIVAAFDKADAQGVGVIGVSGRMVDKPIAERARQTLSRARRFR